MKRHLFVVAHPDDEVLGAGAFIFDSVKNGDKVAVVVLNTCDTTRYKDNFGKIKDDLELSHKVLGLHQAYLYSYTDSNFQREDHRKMVRDIEEAIKDFQPDTLFTQHPGDINTDHYWTFAACMEAFRIWQRQTVDANPIEAFYLMEVQSSTDWGINPCENRFEPNTFVRISPEGLDAKVDALSVYENVIRPVPHPRSTKALYSLPVLRGAQAGYPLAEAFQCVFRRGSV